MPTFTQRYFLPRHKIYDKVHPFFTIGRSFYEAKYVYITHLYEHVCLYHKYMHNECYAPAVALYSNNHSSENSNNHNSGKISWEFYPELSFNNFIYNFIFIFINLT